MAGEPTTQDWTRGPAKAGAIIVLGAAAVFGVLWSVATRPQQPPAPMPSPGSGMVLGPEESPAEPPVLLLDPNIESAERLRMLPGIGPALSARIVEERDANGPFRSAGDLARVHGIGERTVERLAPFLVFPAAEATPD